MRKVGCATFDSDRLLPASAFTNVTSQPKLALNFLGMSGSANNVDRTIESLRVHYMVKRNAEAPKDA